MSYDRTRGNRPDLTMDALLTVARQAADYRARVEFEEQVRQAETVLVRADPYIQRGMLYALDCRRSLESIQAEVGLCAWPRGPNDVDVLVLCHPDREAEVQRYVARVRSTREPR